LKSESIALNTMKIFRTISTGNQIVEDLISQNIDHGTSPSLSIKICFSGSATFSLDNRELNLFPGYFLTVNEGTSYTRIVDSLAPVKTFAIIFDSGFLADFNRTQFQNSKSLLDSPFIDSNSEIILPEAIYPFVDDFKYNVLNLKSTLCDGLTDDLLINSYFHHCLEGYYRIYHSEVANKVSKLAFSNRSTKIEMMKRLLVAKDYIISNYDQKVRIDEVAKIACLSINHFLRNFKLAYRMSPYQFLLQVRLQRAAEILKNTDLPVSEIASIVGFDSSPSFIMLFRKAYKITPFQYRKSSAKI